MDSYITQIQNIMYCIIKEVGSKNIQERLMKPLKIIQ